MATIEELINDSKLADDQEILVGEQKFKLGDIRSVGRARMGEVEKQRQQLEADRSRVNKLAEDALTLWQTLQIDPPKNQPAQPEDEFDFPDNPQLSKIGKALKKKLEDMATAQAKADKQQEELRKALAQGFQYVVTNTYEDRWNKLADKPSDKSWKDYLKVAQDNKIVDQWGLPDPIKAYEDSTREQRLEAAKKAEYERGKAEAMKSQPPAMPRPGTAGASRSSDKGSKVYDTVDTLLDDAFADTEISKIMNGVVQ